MSDNCVLFERKESYRKNNLQRALTLAPPPVTEPPLPPPTLITMVEVEEEKHSKLW
jgi:hypothetical protein